MSDPGVDVAFLIVEHMLSVEKGSAGLGIDDHKRARRAVPAEFGGRGVEASGKLGLTANAEAVAEAVEDGPFFPERDLHLVGDAVGSHHPQGVLGDYSVAKIADAAAGESVGKFNKIVYRGDQPCAAAFVFAAGDVGVRELHAQSLFARVVVAVLRSHTRADFVGRNEGRIDHSAGLEDIFFAVFAESHTRYNLDQAGKNVVAEAVLELRSGLEIKRYARKRGDEVARRCTPVGTLDYLAKDGRSQVVVEPRRHREKVVEGYGRFAIDRKAALFDVKLVKFGEILRDRVLHQELALLEKLKCRDAGHDLGAGIGIVKLVPAQGLADRVTPKLLVVAVNDDIRRRNAVSGQGVDEVFEICKVHGCAPKLIRLGLSRRARVNVALRAR